MLKICELYKLYFAQLDDFENGKRVEKPAVPCNRAYSRVVGWPAVLQPRNVTTVRKASYPHGFPFGPATVERSDDFSRVTVDLCSTIPECDSNDAFGDFGSVDLGIVLGGEFHKLVTVLDQTSDYQGDHQRSAGIVDIAVSTFDDINGARLTQRQFDNNPLALKASSCAATAEPPTQWTAESVVALAENPLYAATNTRGVYVEEPDPDVAGPTTSFTVHVKAFNDTPTEQVGLVVAQYNDADLTLLTGDSRPLVVFYESPSGTWVEIENDTVVDATSGSVRIGLRGASGANAPVSGSLPLIFFLPVAHHLVAGTALTPHNPVYDMPGVVVPNDPSSGLPRPPSAFYAAVRVHPYRRPQLAEFEAFLADGPNVAEVNNWVFEKVYETFHLMFPVMDFIASPQDIQRWRRRILEVTRPDYFDRSAYMPPTRTLTAAQREILELYDAYLDGVNATGSALRTRSSSAHRSAEADGNVVAPNNEDRSRDQPLLRRAMMLGAVAPRARVALIMSAAAGMIIAIWLTAQLVGWDEARVWCSARWWGRRSTPSVSSAGYGLGRALPSRSSDPKHSESVAEEGRSSQTRPIRFVWIAMTRGMPVLSESYAIGAGVQPPVVAEPLNRRMPSATNEVTLPLISMCA